MLVKSRSERQLLVHLNITIDLTGRVSYTSHVSIIHPFELVAGVAILRVDVVGEGLFILDIET